MGEEIALITLCGSQGNAKDSIYFLHILYVILYVNRKGHEETIG
jgi:hypothetical protein